MAAVPASIGWDPRIIISSVPGLLPIWLVVFLFVSSPTEAVPVPSGLHLIFFFFSSPPSSDARISCVLASVPYSHPVHSSPPYHSLPGYHLAQPAGSLSHQAALHESPALLEREGAPQCPRSFRRSIKRESELMSSTLAVSSPDGARQAEDHGTFDRKRPRPDDDSASSDGPDPVRPRPLSWHPSAPVEPSMKSTQLRSIGVESILNPPSKAAVVAAENGREGLTSQLPTASSSHARLPSSPSVHLPSPSLHPAKRLSSSPAMRSHQAIAPASPSARFVAAGGYPQKLGVSQSPLAHASRLASYSTAPGSPLSIDPVSGQPIPTSTHPAVAPISIHSTPTFHSRRTSANPTPAPSSQETSPTTPVSAYSQLGRSSPAVSAAPLAQNTPSFLGTSPYGTPGEPATRLPSVMAGPRHTGEEADAVGGPPVNPPYPGMIPCVLDLKSGSSSQAEKRRANSDASRRFRNRKRNELQLEQKIAGQQDEIRKHTEALQRQAQEIRSLLQERDFYRSERDFFRDHVTRLVPAGQLPTRPASPRALRPSFETASEREREATWHASEASRKVETTSGPGSKLAPAPSNLMARSSTRPPVTWSTTPTAYPATHVERSVLPDEQQARTLPQFPGQWARSS
ncbi:hypothetical protein BO78DRAFT_388820 [Aspergillus sclerotiicarbonarius CBS 121057]|uniref:BZIP domain-containing protein n=1 Tax=Aspergillus sclerotiicarbonarius (strain CBS 121057 / IBT 28362) TaxID=1448318 RepID=A0A319FCL9_ASPSB|nr:hypothetical protein BO78DRAFT_388820 [Aspergillus sclerotiicarbonarius CBS 121057]